MRVILFWRQHRDKVWATLVVVLFLVVVVQSNNVKRQGRSFEVETTASRVAPAVFTPYMSYVRCRKFNAGDWRLRTEIAHQRKNANGSGGDYEITCSYWGQELMTISEANL